MNKKCEHLWSASGDSEFEKCSACKCVRFRPTGKPFMEVWDESAKIAMEEIKRCPFGKKLFNFLKNDFTGFINSYKNKDFSFEHNDGFIEKSFMDEFVNLMKMAGFHNERYDKKLLKDKLMEFLSENIQKIIKGKRQIEMSPYLPLCERELKFLIYVKNNYD